MISIFSNGQKIRRNFYLIITLLKKNGYKLPIMIMIGTYDDWSGWLVWFACDNLSTSFRLFE